MNCPKCGSEKVCQFRMPTGPIWCADCGFHVEHKEIFNPFIPPKRKPLPSVFPLTDKYRQSFGEEKLDYKNYDLTDERAMVIELEMREQVIWKLANRLSDCIERLGYDSAVETPEVVIMQAVEEIKKGAEQ